MVFRKQQVSCEEARQIDMVTYLSSLGYEPVRIRNLDYWYLSPLRQEKTPSFKVNRKLNRWYDHGLGKGGNLIDFAVLYSDCTVGEFLGKINPALFFHQPALLYLEGSKREKEQRITILREHTLTSFTLLRYLYQRRIPVAVAERFCNEVVYALNGRTYFAIGFKNNAGGYELRNPYFKGSSTPKDLTVIDIGAKKVDVFEGFFDFLSFQTIHQNQPPANSSTVVLNSLSFFEKARPFIERHDAINLYLDRDKSGQNYTRYALSLSGKYRDNSDLYKHHKDLNDWMMNIGK
ncbi:toprim domain-containing protein [Flavisolibacter nicotianae]|uniref:toprim domain-containing protein n=1 Tax=Flavisolibacter nicotianae TaxID=2364882 RepID=UPI000EAC1536|nr:toprim domain-containing protein [Flavisolibacter nicotianae]